MSRLYKGVSLLKAKLLSPHYIDKFPDKILARRSGRRPPSVILLITIDHYLAQMQFHMLAKYAEELAVRGFMFISRTYDSVVAGTEVPLADAVFVQSGYTPASGELEAVMIRLRNANPQANITYFDWFAPTDIRMAEKVEPYVQFYIKKSLLRKREAYLAEPVGHTNLSDYYASNYGTDNPPPTWTIPPDIVPRLMTGPSFSAARELIDYFEEPALVSNGERTIDLQARIETNGTPWYQLMRRQAAAAVDGLTGVQVVTGRITKKLYMAEMAMSKLCFSPFGYGEVCWRDFEAVAMGAVLVKPDMSHIECNPDIYQDGMTYVAVKWDFSDLAEKVAALLADPAAQRTIAANAYAVLHDYLRGDALLDLLAKLTRHRLVPRL